MNISRTAFIASALILAALIGPRLRAEGTLRGRVVDEKENAIPEARIAIRGQQGLIRTIADQNGNYHFYGLTPGIYEITVSADTFSSYVAVCLSVRSGYTLTFNWTMGHGCPVVVRYCGQNLIDKTSSTTGVYLSRDMLEKFYR